jgi:hypothetical protein
MALGLPGAVESAHMNHPDFRVGGKIFATLGYPDESCGMVALTPEAQREFVRQAPDVFNPCKGSVGTTRRDQRSSGFRNKGHAARCA